MKTLVVCYSRTGKTKTVAELLAKELQADLDEIRDTKDRRGILGFILSGRDAINQRTTNINPVQYDPAAYDMVVVATPVWASNISTPVLTYLRQYKDTIKAVSFVTTQGGAVADRVFDRLTTVVGKKPAGSLGIAGADLKSGAYQEKVKNLVGTISRQ